MRSFFRDDPVTNWLGEVPPSCHKEDYLKYAYEANLWLNNQGQNHERPQVPSEMWIGEDEELRSFSIISDKQHSKQRSGKMMRQALISGVMNKHDWQDTRIKEIMSARHLTKETGSSEYLNVTGQKIRHDFVEGVMYQCIKVRDYANVSHYRMHKYVITRCILEVILSKNNVYCPPAGVPDKDKALKDTKDQLERGFSFWMRMKGLNWEDLVVDAVLTGELNPEKPEVSSESDEESSSELFEDDTEEEYEESSE